MRLTKQVSNFIIHIWKSRSLLLALIKNDFKKQYFGSYLGLAWAFIQPLMFVAIIWIVFDLGFRTGPTVTGVPFVLWLLAGMVPWFFFSDALRSGTEAVTSNAFLVKQVAFRVSTLPLVNIGSCFLVHLGLVFFLTLALLFNGYWPNLYWLQLPFYLASTILFATGFSWLTSAIRVFVKDISSMIGIFLQMVFWLTPIFWSLDIIPEKYHYMIKLNPVYYIIDGYRDTFIGQVWFWQKPIWSFYYLGTSAVFLILGALVFKRLRPHFADVL